MVFWLTRNTLVNNLDSIPQPFHSFYNQKDNGQYEFTNTSDDPTVNELISSVIRLENTLAKYNEENKAPKIDLSPLADYGGNVQEILDHITELKTQLDQKAGVDPKKIRDEIAADLNRRHASELEKERATVTSLNNQLDELLVDNEISRVVGQYSPGKLEIWKPILRQSIKTETDSFGKRHAYVVDNSGDRRFSAATVGDMTIDELMLEYRGNPMYGTLFPSETPSGGGTPGAGRRQTNGIPPAARKLNPVEKIQSGLNSGNTRFGHPGLAGDRN